MPAPIRRAKVHEPSWCVSQTMTCTLSGVLGANCIRFTPISTLIIMRVNLKSDAASHALRTLGGGLLKAEGIERDRVLEHKLAAGDPALQIGECLRRLVVEVLAA